MVDEVVATSQLECPPLVGATKPIEKLPSSTARYGPSPSAGGCHAGITIANDVNIFRQDNSCVALTIDEIVAKVLALADPPFATPVVMSVGREKATAAHVYCAQGRIRGERSARHWHDLDAIARSEHFEVIMADRSVAQAVADHKNDFFSEKDVVGKVIDYSAAANGQLKIVRKADALATLADDHAKMVGDGLAFDAS